MQRILRVGLVIGLLLLTAAPALAQGGAPPEAPAARISWPAVVVFLLAIGGYVLYKRALPKDTIQVNTCAPLIDEQKMEAEKRRILEEEQGGP